MQDSGGYTKSGELPSAECIHLHSERELKQELDSVQKKLAPSAEWTTRIQVRQAALGRVMSGGCCIVVLSAGAQSPVLVGEHLSWSECRVRRSGQNA